MKNTTFLIIVMLSIISSCKKEKVKKELVSRIIEIKGEIENLKDSTLILLKKSNKVLDSAYLINKTFKLLYQNIDGNNTLGYIYIKNKKNKVLADFEIWLSDKNLEVKGDINKELDINIVNDNANENLRNYRKFMYKYNEIINKKLSASKTQRGKNQILNNYLNIIKKEQKEFIFKNPNNTFCLDEFFQYSDKLPIDSLLLFYKSLQPKFKNSKNGLFLKEYLSTKKMKIGEHFKDFTARDLEGNTVKLSDFKGKVIVLDFWAKWCKWCHVQNNKEFAPLHAKYKDDIVIVSYALDKNMLEWKESSSKNIISWINLSNLKGTKDPVAYQYGVTLLPHTFLIDKKGIIIKEYTGYSGENIIEADIKKLLSE